MENCAPCVRHCARRADGPYRISVPVLCSDPKGWREAINLGHYSAPMQNSCAVVTRATLQTRRELCLAYVTAYATGVWRLSQMLRSVSRCFRRLPPAWTPKPLPKAGNSLLG